MTRLIYCLLTLAITWSCTDSSNVDEPAANTVASAQISTVTTDDIPSLTFVWETDSLLTTVESVIYDPETQFIYTANIEGDFMEKDGQGSISKINLNGEIVERDWIRGLNAPTGLSIANGTLYTTDIDRLIEIDITAGEIRNVFPIEGATALNDVTIAPEGVVYASDTGGNAIYKLENGVTSSFVDEIDTPNGLVYHENTLLVSQWNPQSLQALDLSTKSLTHIADGLSQADGVYILEDQRYLVSSWGGRLFYIDQEGNTTTILDTSAEGKNAADVTLIPDQKTVLVATFSKNAIAAYAID